MDYDAFQMRQMVEKDPEAIHFYKNIVSQEDILKFHLTRDEILFSVYQTAYDNGLKIDFDLLEKYPELCQNEMFLKFIMTIDDSYANYVQFYEGMDTSVYREAIKHGYLMYPQEVERFSYDASYMKSLIEVDPKLVRFYHNTATSKDFFVFSFQNDPFYPGMEEQKKEVLSVYEMAFQNGLVIDEQLF